MPFLKDYTITVDNSALERICPREFELSVIRRKRLNTESAALSAGQAMHAALELFYKGEQDFDILAGAIEKNMPVVDPGEWRVPSLYMDALGLYIQKYRNRDFTVYKNYIELPFALPLGAVEVSLPFTHDRDYRIGDRLEVVYTGKVDLIVQEGKQFFVVDHKTASRTGNAYWTHFDLSQQTLGYVWAAKQAEPDLNIVGAYLNAIVVRQPTKTGKGFELERKKYYYTPAMIEEWQQDVLHQISAHIHRLQQSYFPKQTYCCVKARPYGTCDFHSICQKDPKYRETAIELILEDSDWDPLNVMD